MSLSSSILRGRGPRMGEIGPFRPAGLGLILRARTWKVHAFVVDGLWQYAKFKHLLGSMDTLDARMEYVGEFEWTNPKADAGLFVEGTAAEHGGEAPRDAGGAGRMTSGVPPSCGCSLVPCGSGPRRSSRSGHVGLRQGGTSVWFTTCMGRTPTEIAHSISWSLWTRIGPFTPLCGDPVGCGGGFG